jgi:DNA-binding NarL/FixJ family response regulator
MKILIADDHALFREGLRHILMQLDRDVTVLEAANHDATAKLLAQHQDADLALVDLNMPGREGTEALSELLAGSPTVPVVVLSASEHRRDMRRALDAGAMGFIPKSETAHVMLSAVRLVLSGGVYIPPALVKGEMSAAPDGGAGELTPRQRDVLERLIQGKPNKEIGRELGLSEATVKVHVTAIFRTLNVSNRTQAARAAESLRLFARRS